MELTSVGSYEFAIPVGDLLIVAGSIAWEGDRGWRIRAGWVTISMSLSASRALAEPARRSSLPSTRPSVHCNRVVRLVRLTGYVRSAPDFGNQPQVMNGASDLMLEVFGDAGRHARSAIGLPELPLGASVEIDSLFHIAR